MEQPYFSVVIPVYNRAAIIEPTLQSVLAQTEQSFELIIVDDCSADFERLEQVISEQNDNRLVLLKHESNKNGAAARNTGIQAAKGKYIAFLDSDDTWPENRLEIVRGEIESHPSPKNTIFYGQVDFKFPAEESGVVMPTCGIGKSKVADYLFIERGLIQTSTIVCSLEAAQKISFDERFIRHQDYDFCLRAEKLNYSFEFIEKVLSNWLRYKGANPIAKGAKVEFCLFWLEQMKSMMSTSAFHAYKLTVLLPIACESGTWSQAFSIVSRSSFKTPPKVLFRGLYKSLKGVVKHILARIK